MRLVGVAFLLASACSAHDGEVFAKPLLGEHAQPILGGVPSGDDQNAAVLIVRGNFLEYCTAVVVAPTLLLTTRHCLFDVALGENGYVHCEQPTDVVSVRAAQRADTIGVYIGSEKPLPPEPAAIGVRVHSSDDLNLCQNDLALLELDRPLPLEPLALRLDGPPRVGESGTLIGWGFTAPTGPSLAEHRQQREIIVEALGPSIYDPDEGPPRNIRDSAFVGTEGACVGDNGGPLISAETGAVFGIMSDIDNPDAVIALEESNVFDNCVGGNSHFQRIDLQQHWLRRAFRERGLNPWLEGKSRPAEVGMACMDADDCLSGLCVSAGATSLCSVDCSVDACPADMQCVGPPEQRVCVPPEVPGAAVGAPGCQLSPGRRAPSGLRWLLGVALFAASSLRRSRGHRGLGQRRS